MDEILYGGGKSVPVRADGDQPDEANVVSEMFFLAEGTVISSEFEIIATQPMAVPGSDGPEMYILATFKGLMNNENRLGAFTVVMRPEGLLAFTKSARQIYSQIPLEYR